MLHLEQHAFWQQSCTQTDWDDFGFARHMTHRTASNSWSLASSSASCCRLLRFNSSMICRHDWMSVGAPSCMPHHVNGSGCPQLPAICRPRTCRIAMLVICCWWWSSHSSFLNSSTSLQDCTCKAKAACNHDACQISDVVPQTSTRVKNPRSSRPATSSSLVHRFQAVLQTGRLPSQSTTCTCLRKPSCRCQQHERETRSGPTSTLLIQIADSEHVFT